MPTVSSIKDILAKFNPLEDKYVSREYQAYGLRLAEELGDEKRKSLYIKLSKTVPRALLEKALNHVKGSPRAHSLPRLFMWKLKKLKN